MVKITAISLEMIAATEHGSTGTALASAVVTLGLSITGQDETRLAQTFDQYANLIAAYGCATLAVESVTGAIGCAVAGVSAWIDVYKALQGPPQNLTDYAMNRSPSGSCTFKLSIGVTVAGLS